MSRAGVARPACRVLAGAALASHALMMIAVARDAPSFGAIEALLAPAVAFAWLAPGLLLSALLRPEAMLAERSLHGAGLAAAVQISVATASRLFGTPTPPMIPAALATVVSVVVAARLWTRPPSNLRPFGGADRQALIVTWDPLESTCRHASLSIL